MLVLSMFLKYSLKFKVGVVVNWVFGASLAQDSLI